MQVHLFSPTGQQALADLMTRQALLAFDFDGTLTPIIARPGDVRLSVAVASRLRALAARLPVAIVTGRSLQDVRPRLRFEPTYLVGSHGAEDEGEPAAAAHWSRRLDALRACLDDAAAELLAAGVTVEDKGASVALHHRLAPDPQRAQAAIAALATRLPPGLRSFGGKRVLNIVADDAPDKADAVHRLVQRSGCSAALFAGDDINDEPVFERAPPGWLTIRIGRVDAGSRARFFLDSPQEVALLLERLRVMAGGGGAGGEPDAHRRHL